MKKISLADFEAAGVCTDGFIHFRAAFGDEVEVTEANCRAMAGKLNFAFGAEKFLTGRQQVEFRRVVVPAAEVAAERMRISMEQFESALIKGADFVEALKERETREAPIRRAHETLQAIEFARCYNLDP